MRFFGILVLFFSLILLPQPAVARETTKFEALHAEVRKRDDLIPEIRNAERATQDEMLCMALNLYHEIRGGNSRDQWAVAFVVLNRTKDRRFGRETICGIVWAPGQFSWTRRGIESQLPRERGAWLESQRKAYLAVRGQTVSDPTNGATNFHSVRVSPSWSSRLLGRIRIGPHMFGRLPSG